MANSTPGPRRKRLSREVKERWFRRGTLALSPRVPRAGRCGVRVPDLSSRESRDRSIHLIRGCSAAQGGRAAFHGEKDGHAIFDALGSQKKELLWIRTCALRRSRASDPRDRRDPRLGLNRQSSGEGQGRGMCEAQHSSAPLWKKKRKNSAKTSGRSRKLTRAQKAEARRRARKAGRPYPNLVDNMAAARNTKKRAKKK